MPTPLSDVAAKVNSIGFGHRPAQQMDGSGFHQAKPPLRFPPMTVEGEHKLIEMFIQFRVRHPARPPHQESLQIDDHAIHHWQPFIDLGMAHESGLKIVAIGQHR